MYYISLLSVFVSVGIVTFLILLWFSRRSSPSLKRLGNTDSAEGKGTPNIKSGFEKKKSDEYMDKLLTTLSDFTPKNDKKNSRLRTKLLHAGYQRDEHLRNFYGIKLFIASLLFFVYFFLGIWQNKSGAGPVLLSALVGLAGYIFPDLILTLKINKRQEEIASGLSDALDFLVICVEAGLGLNAAILRVGKEMQLKCKALSQELLLVNQEMRTGLSREEALRNLSLRNRVNDLKVLAGSIILSDRLGTNIADTLRAQSDSIRTRIRQKAEEQAAKAGIKMIFPLAFCILPALFIVILGPAFIKMIDVLGPIFQK